MGVWKIGNGKPVYNDEFSNGSGMEFKSADGNGGEVGM